MSGDLYVDIQIRAHELFKRDGDQLFADIPIAVTTAVLGGQIKVPTLDGEVMLKVPPETQSGRTFRLRGKGVKSVRSSRTGDLMVRVDVETPINLNRDQKDLLREFQQSLDAGKRGEHSPQAKSWTDSVQEFFDRMGF